MHMKVKTTTLFKTPPPSCPHLSTLLLLAFFFVIALLTRRVYILLTLSPQKNKSSMRAGICAFLLMDLQPLEQHITYLLNKGRPCPSLPRLSLGHCHFTRPPLILWTTRMSQSSALISSLAALSPMALGTVDMPSTAKYLPFGSQLSPDCWWPVCHVRLDV